MPTPHTEDNKQEIKTGKLPDQPTFQQEIVSIINGQRDEAYNLGLDHAVEMIKVFSKSHSLNNDPFLLFHHLIQQIQSLKK